MPMINIFVCFPFPDNSQAFNVSIDESSTGLDLNRMVEERSGIPLRNVSWMKGRDFLRNDNDALRKYNVKNYSVIFVIRKLL
jgi:hypothetical protein